MPNRVLLGQKLRAMRIERAMSQVSMAKRLGISASYLNLIEHNQRGLTPKIRAQLIDAFGLEFEALSGARETRLRDELAEVLADPLFREFQDARDSLNDVVTTAPALCGATIEAYRKYRAVYEDLRALSEQLSEDPFIADSSHQLLTILTSVRSFAEILQDNSALSEDKRREFTGILVGESERLTDLVKQLFAFIGDGGLGKASAAELPRDEVDEAIQARNNHFPSLEALAEQLRERFDQGSGSDLLTIAEVIRLLAQDHKVTIVRGAATQPGGNGKEPAGQVPTVGGPDAESVYLPESRNLYLSDRLPPSELFDRATRQLVILEAEERLEEMISVANLSSETARDIYRSRLADYVVNAIKMPYEPFRQEARQRRHDLEALQNYFGASFEQVCQRLTTLHRPGAEGIPFHVVSIDIAGNILKRFSASGLTLPRYGGACPRWNLHSAFTSPGRIACQRVRLPEGAGYLFISRATVRPGAGFDEPAVYISTSIGCDSSFAGQIVYGDAMNLDHRESAVPVGVNCRQCPREDCAQRAYPSLMQ